MAKGVRRVRGVADERGHALAADLHHLSGCFRAAGKDATTDHRIGQRQGLDDVARLGDPAIGEDRYAALSGGA